VRISETDFSQIFQEIIPKKEFFLAKRFWNCFLFIIFVFKMSREGQLLVDEVRSEEDSESNLSDFIAPDESSPSPPPVPKKKVTKKRVRKDTPMPSSPKPDSKKAKKSNQPSPAVN